MIVIYAEKADMGKKIAAAIDGITLTSGKKVSFSELDGYKGAISKQQKADGFLKISYFGKKECYVTWGWGHMYRLKHAYDYNPDYRNWSKLPVPFIPEKFEYLPVQTGDKVYDDRNKTQLKVIKELFKKADLIISATDNDREGDCIFKYIYDNLRCKKPYKRAIIVEQTEKSLKQTFEMKNLVESTDRRNIEDAGRARNIADWVVGSNLTAQLTIRQRSKDVLSVGRVQTATLAILVAREKAIRGFSKSYYYTIDGEFTKANGERYTGTHIQKKFENKSDAAAVFDDIKNSKTATVTEIKENRSKLKVPSLYNQAALQMECNSKFGLKLADTLAIAQFLYDNGYTTYPRTSSQFLTDDMSDKVNEVLDSLEGLPEYNSLISSKPRKFFSKDFFDSKKAPSHHAIIPTGVVPKGLTPIQQKVYDLIAKSVIRMLYEAAETVTTTVTTSVGKEKFISQSKRIAKKGWLEVTPEYEEKLLPALAIGEKVSLTVVVNEKETKAPGRYTDKSFLAAMISAGKDLDDKELKKIMANPDNPGIGTEATRAEIVETLVRRSYAERSGKNIYATDKGIALIDNLCIDDIKSPEITARWEQRLNNIEKGTDSFESFTEDIFAATEKWCRQIKSSAVVLELSSKPEVLSVNCPACGKPMRKFSWGWGCSGYSDGCKFAVSGKIASKKITDTQFKTLVTKGITNVISGFKSKKGKTFKAKLKVDGDQVVFEFS